MPVVDYKQYCKMLDTAKEKKYAYAAINVTSTETANAALKGFADAKSDGCRSGEVALGDFFSRPGQRGFSDRAPQPA